MKEIINMHKLYGAEMHTRQVVEKFAASLSKENEYLLDMKGVCQISRSAADEIYILTHSDKKVELINLEPFVEKMLSAVTLGRFLPRKHLDRSTPIIDCTTIESAIQQLVG